MTRPHRNGFLPAVQNPTSPCSRAAERRQSDQRARTIGTSRALRIGFAPVAGQTAGSIPPVVQGEKTTLTAFVVLKPLPHGPSELRYQPSKFHVWPAKS